MKSILVEKNDIERAYGFRGTEAIIESEERGRLLIMDGFGGERTMAGGAVRWRHGLAIKIKASDTLTSLNCPFGIDGLSLMDRIVSGYGGHDGREIQDLEGKSIVALANSAGIA